MSPGDVLETVVLAVFFLALIITAIILAYNVGFSDGAAGAAKHADEECDDLR